MQTVLVIDDNQHFRALIKRILEDAGFAVLTAEDGRQGMACIRSDKPDIVLCDIQMPVMTGYEVCQAVRADPAISGVPIMLVSIQMSVNEVVRGLKLGADDYMMKPFIPEELLGRVRFLLSKPRKEVP